MQLELSPKTKWFSLSHGDLRRARATPTDLDGCLGAFSRESTLTPGQGSILGLQM